MSLSLITMPVLLDSPLSSAQLCSVWSKMYMRGRGLLPAMAVMTFAMYWYASCRKKSTRSSKALIMAGVMTIAIAPFTWLFLAPTNNKLFALQRENQAMPMLETGLESARRLMTQWSQLHLMRSLLPLFGAAAAILCGA
jgi:noranthrone monooxygenase